MKIADFFSNKEYDFTWPIKEPTEQQQKEGYKPIPQAEKITLHCRRFGHNVKAEIEDSMVTVKGSRLERATNTDDVEMGWKLGTTKAKRIERTVFGWEGVLDEEGNPIKFSTENLFTLLDMNGGLDASVYGHLESDLLDEIERRHSFADKTRLTEKNS